MAGPPSYPAPPSASSSSPSTVAYTPSSASIANSSDNNNDPNSLHSHGGPQQDDLPPSYDEAQDQAVHDSRNGIAPIDPSQIEAHRITLHEGPDEPEVWEYRVRGEQLDPENEREEAPDYANHMNDKATSVPVQHVSVSEHVPVGHMSSETISPTVGLDAMLDEALAFTRNEPDAIVQNAPGLNRPIALPELGGASVSAAQILCAYAHALQSKSVRPAAFLDFLHGLNILLKSTDTTARDLLHGPSHGNNPSTVVQDYLRAANETYFALRGLRISVYSQSALLDKFPIPAAAGQRAAIVAHLLDKTRTAEMRAHDLTPWIESLDVNVPYERTGTLKLREMSEQYLDRVPAHRNMDFSTDASSEKRRVQAGLEEHEDPPHSVSGSRFPEDQQAGPWSPFGAPGSGPFGAPGNGPFGPPGSDPLANRGTRSFGERGPGNASHASQQGSEWRGNEWAEVGKELGRMGEQFGRRMGDWGVDFGKRANTWGLEVGKRASGSASQSRAFSGPAYYQSPPDDLPPLYEAPAGQETGVLSADPRVDPRLPAYPAEKNKNKSEHLNYDDDDDDDTSSISSSSSDSSDSSSSSCSSDDEEISSAEATFAARLASINAAASTATQKGKKSPTEVAHERSLALEQAHAEREATLLKFASKQSRRAAKRQMKLRKRELKRLLRQRKRELKTAHAGKGKGKAKKSREWKSAKREYKESMKALKREKKAAKKEWKEFKNDGQRRGKRELDSLEGFQGDDMVWLVIENVAS